MDRHESQIISARGSSKRKREPEFQDQNQAHKVVVVEDPNKDVQSNATTRSTSSSMGDPTPPSSSESDWDHDVFLSFRGEDTRKNFTDHLYSALVRVGIRTFRDDEELPRGKTISTELLSAIRGSRISIVIFSEGYVSSSWCLDELVEIVRCRKTTGHTLLPIFYHVDPSDLRKQIGAFGEAFVRHEERFHTDIERVQSWRAALTEAVNCSGWDLESVANGYESRFIEAIVEEVLCKVYPARLNVAKHPVGIDSHVKEMKVLLKLGTSDVRIVGIYGMGGIGKTTLANAVYNEICDAFEGNSFLSNVKESSEKPHGLVHLQEQLLYDISKKHLKIDNANRGIILINERLHRKRVLIVLDDVDDFERLHALVEKQWFGPGSRIIVTTRDEHLLRQLGVDEKYKVRELNHWESLRLFSWHAFEMVNPEEDYSKLSIEAVNYAGGLPLALVVLGSFLKRRSIVEWESELEKLQRSPHEKIQKILRRSYDSLDRSTKDIFLDIACFFVGIDEEYAIKILDDCNFSPGIGIPLLIQRSLVTIDYSNKLKMHDLIRDMGREIVCEESPKYPEKRSRLWFHEDVLTILDKQTGSETVEALILNLFVLEDVNLKTEAFTNMKNLKLLQINDVHLTESYEHLSKELKCLCWHKCHLKFLPQNFHLENLVILDMQHSNVKQLWKKNKILNKLKVLNLSNSKYLTESPNFSQVPQLEILILEGCISLVQVHESIGNLKRLVSLNLEGCKNFRNLPRSISNLKSLKTLNVFGCSKLDKLPEEFGSMIALTCLFAYKTAIKQLPSSFDLLKNLKSVSLSRCKEQSSQSWLSPLSSWMSPKILNPINLLPASISGLCSLTCLHLRECNLSEDVIPVDFGSLSALMFLDLSKNNFRNVPDCINRLPKLRCLYLSDCTDLQSISGLPASLCLISGGRLSSKSVSLLCHPRFLDVHLDNCPKLTRIQSSENLFAIKEMFVEECNNLTYDFSSHLQWQLYRSHGSYNVIFLHDSEVTNWFGPQRIGSSISFHVPSIPKGQILWLLVCADYAESKEYNGMDTARNQVIIHNKTRGYLDTVFPFGKFNTSPTPEDRVFLYQQPLIFDVTGMESRELIRNKDVMEFGVGVGDEIEVFIELSKTIKVKKCVVHVVVEDPNCNGRISVIQSLDSDTAKDDVGHLKRRPDN